MEKWHGQSAVHKHIGTNQEKIVRLDKKHIKKRENNREFPCHFYRPTKQYKIQILRVFIIEFMCSSAFPYPPNRRIQFQSCIAMTNFDHRHAQRCPFGRRKLNVFLVSLWKALSLEWRWFASDNLHGFQLFDSVATVHSERTPLRIASVCFCVLSKLAYFARKYNKSTKSKSKIKFVFFYLRVSSASSSELWTRSLAMVSSAEE